MDIEKIISEMTLEEKAELCSGQDFWKTKSVQRLNVPSVLMCDGPHGLRKQEGAGDHMGITESIKAVCFPSGVSLASSFDVELVRNIGKIIAKECLAEGVGMVLGPGVNIKRSPLCGRNFEYYSEDPYVAGEIGAAMVQGIQSEGVASCVKHFAANNQETRRMSSDSVVDERTLHEIYLKPFEKIVKQAKPKAVMCAYNRVNGTYCSENKSLLKDILRDRWGYDGIVVTDWGAARDIAGGIRAGLNLVMPGGNREYTNRVLAAVAAGKLTESELDDAIRPLLSLIADTKQCFGIAFDREDDRNAATEAAKECAVLLKNEEETLPLSPTDKIAFIGEFAAAPRYQGSGSSRVNSAKVMNALDAAQGYDIAYARGYDAKRAETDEALLQEAVKTAKNSAVAVLFVGLPGAFETEGKDRDALELPANQTELIEAVSQVQPKTVVVLHNGAPVTMPWVSAVSAVLEMYLAGDGVGEATVSVLFGKTNPSGKLAETFLCRSEDASAYLNFPGERGVVEYREGVFVGYRYYDKKKTEVLFPFGHGLSYTSFEYSDLKTDRECIEDSDILMVSLRVKNTGNRFGKEVIQLYIGNKKSTVSRPLRELKRFCKIALGAGESKTISFSLSKEDFSYYEVQRHDFFVETGEYTICIGSSSRDIRLTETIRVHSSDRIPEKFDRNTTLGDIMRSEKGRTVLAQFMQGADRAEKSSQVEYLGEGADELAQNTANEMTLLSLCNFRGIPLQKIDAVIDILNR